jgi:CHASE1-domain containing sensor protein
MPMSCFTLVVDVLAARSSYAKDREHTSSGRSPDFWLQALLISPSHSNSEQWLDLFSVGEGTGAVLAMSIIEAALHAHREMATFAEAGVSTREE